MTKQTALLAGLITLLALLILTGCRTAPELNDEPDPQPRRARVAQMPSPEELGDNPCGNPNWAKLPPGVGEFEGERPATADAEDSDDGEAPAEEE